MEGTALYRLRGQLLPLIFLDRMLSPASHPARNAAQPNGLPLGDGGLAGSTGGESETNIASESDHFIAVLDADGRRYGLVVDGLADPEEIVVKPLSAVLKLIGLYSGATVLGSGELALILDPGSIATRAGVTAADDKGRIEEIGEDLLEDSMVAKFLLVEAAERRAAVALGDVLRIERIPRSRIEYVGYHPVLNFQGQLLPVEDATGILAAAGSEPDAQITVVVCRDGNRQVGIAVHHVLDVAAGSDLFEAGSEHQASGVTLVKDHVTGIVDLAAIAPLPFTSHASQQGVSDWNSVVETQPETVA
jgi:two-component system chemotaxis sensor kinase CheA